MKNNNYTRKLFHCVFFFVCHPLPFGLSKCGVRVRIKLLRLFFVVGRWHLVCYYLCYILIRQICRLEKQFVKFINIRVGLVGQVVLFFCYCHIRSARLDFGLRWNKSREKNVDRIRRGPEGNAKWKFKIFHNPLGDTQSVRVMGCWVRVERYDNLWLFYKHHPGASSGGAARGYLLDRSRLAFFSC